MEAEVVNPSDQDLKTYPEIHKSSLSQAPLEKCESSPKLIVTEKDKPSGFKPVNINPENITEKNTKISRSVDDEKVEDHSLSFKKPMVMIGPRPKLVKNILDNASSVKSKKPAVKKSEIKKKVDDDDKVTADGDDSPPSLEPKETTTESDSKSAQIVKKKEDSFSYSEPTWGAKPALDDDNAYSFEVLKTGSIISTIDLNTKSFYTFGRLASCDVQIEHPSSSRYHAVVQYCATSVDEMQIGWYLYDLDSTHGTWLNKLKVKPRVYLRLRVGHVIKFGGSSRLYILTGPEHDREEERELSSRVSTNQKQLLEKQTELLRQAELQALEEKERTLTQSTSCTWGMDMEESSASTTELEETEQFDDTAEEAYINDPKKSLKAYFEREGMDEPEYEFLEAGSGKHHCRVQLPLDDCEGKPVYAECIMSGKKREVVHSCALEACRYLDRVGELRKAAQESHKRRKRKWEDDDFYDSDEDTFLDRTGIIEKKRLERMKKSGKKDEEILTYASIQEKLNNLTDEKTELDATLAEDDKKGCENTGDELDALDTYMASIQAGKMDPAARRKFKIRLHEIKLEIAKMQKLADIAKPITI